jgi:hypothetical protein
MKSIASMPAMAGPSFRPLRSSDKSSMKRSQSLSNHKPQDRMRHMARRVPFMAFPGVGSQLSSFARSYSRANIARMGSRTASTANLSAANYGSISDPLLTSPPAKGLEREFSEGAIFGSIFNEEDLEMMQPSWTMSLGMAVFTAVLGQSSRWSHRAECTTERTLCLHSNAHPYCVPSFPACYLPLQLPSKSVTTAAC